MVEYTTVIYYTIYFLYIAALLIDWDVIPTSGDWVTWIILAILMIPLVIICICYSLHLDGYTIFNITGIQFLLMIIVLITFVLLVVLYQFWCNNYIWNNIKDKTRRNFLPLGYQYGSDSEDIRRRLNLTDTDVFPIYTPRTLQEIWETLMTDSSGDKVKSIVEIIMGGDLKDSIDVSYNLLWYLCIAEDPLRSHLSKSERKYLTTLKTVELEQLLGNNYEGAHDRASLLFTILSGRYVPAFELTPRYEQIKNYRTNVVYNLAFNQHKIIDHNNATYSLHPPHVYLSQQPESPIEIFISNLTPNNCHELIERLGLLLPGHNNDRLWLNDEEKFGYLQGELSLYHNVLTRPEGLTQPPPINNMSQEDIMNTLSYYTNAELINAYEPRAKCTSRNDLLRQIYNDVTGVPQWAFTHMHCTNDNTMNIMTAEQHGDMDKDDLDDPTLSFGIHKNYRCYQASELEGSFREYDGAFAFKVPDWIHDDPNNGDIRTMVRKEFPIDSIKQLQTLLEYAPDNYNITALLDKVKIGLDAFGSARMQTLHLKRQYDGFTEEQQQTVKTYIVWMFMYAMWMRFWMGPGFPWPITKVNVRRERDRINNNRSSPEQRDEHIFIQDAVRTSIIETFENDPILVEWIDSLPAVYYDFTTTDAKCASYPIKQTLDQIATGEFCMGFGSDTILKTSCYYIINMLDIKLGPSFDDFINSMFPSILDTEYHVVMSQITSIHNINTPKYRVLSDRLTSLQQPIKIQPGFDPSDYQNNTHID